MQVRALDLRFRQTPGLIAAWLLESDGEKALIETGPASTLPRLLEALAEVGTSPSEIRRLFVTHVHLDHSGAAGWWAGQGAQIYCHPRAQRHLIDPSRLLEGSREVYGEQMESLWGVTQAAAAERVTVLMDGESVPVGKVNVTALDTPGHARHHHAYAVGEVCFTGDVAGMRLPNSNYLSVTSAPPQFELEPYLESIQRLRSLGFAQLCLTHFGEVNEVEAHLSRYAHRVRQVAAQALACRDLEPSAWRSHYAAVEQEQARSDGVSEADWSRLELTNSTAMSADGLRLWAEKNKDQ